MGVKVALERIALALNILARCFRLTIKGAVGACLRVLLRTAALFARLTQLDHLCHTLPRNWSAHFSMRRQFQNVPHHVSGPRASAICLDIRAGRTKSTRSRMRRNDNTKT